MSGDPAMLAERLRSSQLMARAIDAAGQIERRAAWFGQLVRVLQEEGRKGATAVERLDDKLGDVLDVGVTSGSPPEPSALVLAGIDVRTRPIPLDPDQAATVFLIHSQRGWESLPILALRVWPTLTDDGLMMIRIPLLTEPSLPERPPSFLVSKLATTAGPFPELRQSTIEACRQVVQDSARLFVPLAEAYVELVGRERSPADPDAWADIELEPAALTEVVRDRGDTQPPELRSLEIFPAIAAPSGGLDVRVRARIVDKPAGIAREGFTSSPCQASFRSRSGQFSDAMFGTAQRVSGDEFDGIYQATAHFDDYAERGRWAVEYVLLVDQTGNSRTYTGAELQAVGFPSDIELN